MRSSLGHDSLRVVICSGLANAIEKWWIRYIIGPLVVTAPPSLVFGFYEYENVHKSLPHIFVSYLESHQLLIMGIAILYLYLFTIGYGVIQGCSKTKEDIDTKGLLSLFEVLEKVVGAKADRFDSVLNKIESGNLQSDPKEIFLEITQPTQQIALLAEGLHGFFDSIDKSGISFKVTIASIENEKPIGWLYYAPQSEPPRTPMKVLQRPSSSICKAIKTRNIVVVEDFKAEVAKGNDSCYVVSEEIEIDEGSLVCYPIFDPRRDDVPYVLTVVADKRKYFLNRKKPIYKWAIQRFAVRMKLEHHLEVLKHKTATNLKQDG